MNRTNTKLLMAIGAAMFITGCSNDDSAKSQDDSLIVSNSAVNSQDLLAKAYDPCQMLETKDIEDIFPGASIKITTHDMVPAKSPWSKKVLLGCKRR